MSRHIARFSDHVNALYNVHTNQENACYAERMSHDWKTSLKEAIDASGRSMRSLAKEAGLGPNGVSEIFSSKKEPGLTKVLTIIEKLGKSRSEILAGVPLTQETEELIQLLGGLLPGQARAALAVIREMQPAADTRETPAAVEGQAEKSE